MGKFVRFLSYHNAVPISISLVLLTTGAAFAASPEMQGAVISSHSAVVTEDNTYIANKDLASFTPRTEIIKITEDEEYYYVNYKLYTIDIVDYVWQDVVKERTHQVSKMYLEGRDLGAQMTKEFGDLIYHESVYLEDVQKMARQEVTQKTVATVYSGLIGKMLDETTEVFPGYVPVIAPLPELFAQVAAVAPPSVGVPASPASASGGPQIQVLGNNPARIQIGTSYSDLGVIALDASGVSIGVRVFVNGGEKTTVQIDTAAVATWRIRYEAADSAGRVATAERLVEVYDPYSPAPEPEVATSTAPEVVPPPEEPIASSTEPTATSTP